MDEAARARIGQIEREAARGAARNVEALAEYAQGHLAGLVNSLTTTPAPRIAIVSGFWVRHADPPSPETDGPVGAALMARLFGKLGWFVAGMTDEPCEGALRAAFAAGGVADDNIVVVPVSGDPAPLFAWAQARALTHLIAIERPGRAANGKAYNMFGKDLSKHVRAFDPLFLEGPWTTAAIGDGGNEIGMGILPRDVVAKQIKHGRKIAAATPARFTLICGVSNWGAHAIGAALATLGGAYREAYDAVFTDEAETEILSAVVAAGAVDGVSGARELSVDGMGAPQHRAKAEAIRALADELAG